MFPSTRGHREVAADPAKEGDLDHENPARGPRAEGNVFRCGLHFPVEPMKRKDILRKLEERLARGEINEKTYLEIKARYDSEPEEPEESEAPEAATPDLGEAIGAVVAQATAEAARHAGHAAHAVGEALRAVDFSGMGTKLSEESIRILGSGVVTGNPIKTAEFRSAGSARVQGRLEAKTARIAGSCIFDSDVNVEEFRAAGSTRIAGNLKAEEVETSGSLQVDGSIQAEEISSSGSLAVKGAVDAEEFRLSGSVRIDGGLKAEEVDIDLQGASKIPTIEAGEIRVKATGGFFRFLRGVTPGRMSGAKTERDKHA